jgi:hypothetical protein
MVELWRQLSGLARGRLRLRDLGKSVLGGPSKEQIAE